MTDDRLAPPTGGMESGGAYNVVSHNNRLTHLYTIPYAWVVPSNRVILHTYASNQIAGNYPQPSPEYLAYLGIPLVTAIGRPGSVDDVVGVYHFLASDESRFVTGVAIAVDGGWSAGWSERAWDHLVAAGRNGYSSQLPAAAAAETDSAGRR